MRGITEKRGNRGNYAVAAGILVLLAAVFLVSSSGVLGNKSIAGVTVLGLGQVSVVSNYQGAAGPWWLAQVALGGGQTLNVQNPGGSSYSASQLNTNSSYTCSTSCQNDNLQISTTASFLKYPAQGAGVPVDVYYVSYLQNGGAYLTYQSCIGASPGATQSTTTSTGQVADFSGCAGNVQTSQTNYANACTAAGGHALYSGPQYQYQNGLLSKYIGCYQLNAVPYAFVYGLNSAQPEYTVKVVMNGLASTISNNQSNNASNPNLILYNVGSGFTSQSAPSETTVSLVQFVPITAAPGYSIGGLTNSYPAYTVKLEGNGGAGIASQASSIMEGYQTKFGGETKFAQAVNDTSQTNAQLAGMLVQSNVNNQFANASILYGAGGFASTGGSVVGVTLNDPSMLYTRPNLILQIKASAVGLYLGVSSFNITSAQIPSFRSGSTATAYVQIQNTGSAQGGFTVSSQPLDSETVTPGQQSGTLSPGQQQTLTFSINNNNNVNSNTSQGIIFKVCPNPQVAGSPPCVTKTATYSLVPACNNNQVYNGRNCTALTTISVPTTTIPGKNNTNPTTTILPCNPTTGAGCPPPPPPKQFPYWIIAVAAVAIIAVVGFHAYGKRKKGGKKGHRGVG